MTEMGPRTVSYNDDGSITVTFYNNGKATDRVVLVQTQDKICQVISREKYPDSVQ